MRDYQFTVVPKRVEDGRIIAIWSSLPGSYTEGETEAEAMELVKDAIRLNVVDRLAGGGVATNQACL